MLMNHCVLFIFYLFFLSILKAFFFHIFIFFSAVVLSLLQPSPEAVGIVI